MPTPPVFLISNDDGYRANGLAALREIASQFGACYTVAPDREQSATSHSLTLHRPLRADPEGDGIWAVDGTPTDCVHLGLRANLLPERPTIVLTGINHGSNLGDEVTYSGTVAGAMEGCLLGVPSIAFSCVSTGHSRDDLMQLAPWIERVIAFVVEHGLPAGTLLNVNFPDPRRGEIVGIALTRQGTRIYGAEVVEKTDPRHRTYYWIGGDVIDDPAEPGTDVHAIEHRLGSITPLHLKLTNHAALDWLQERGLATSKETAP
ncbi:MAG: 5'/3'-nucleotidase SurE [Candidatus Dadabacteria bacterium]|nr:MAG: 5'/3'-nucleotidase SurE [Candidatus Dadabacteria bacterium]